MHSIRAFLTTVVGLTVTGFAFVVAATFSFAVIGLVVFAAVAGIAVVKLSPLVRFALSRAQFSRRTGRVLRMPRAWRAAPVWNDGNGVIIDA